jgi:hypothetical protein
MSREGITTRTLLNLTLGVATSMRDREQRDTEMGLSEVVQQYQLEFSGTTTTAPTFAGASVKFDFPFHYAPGQRDTDLDRPQFSFGVEADKDIIVGAVVKSWTSDEDDGSVIAAAVRVGMLGAESGLAYKGVLHLSFQGYAALAEDPDDVDVEG